MNAPIIQAKGLTKRYGDKQALANIDFELPYGRIVGLVGANGAGKTTLLKGILGLVPIEGDIEVLGLQPHTQRSTLLEDVCFIADTAILPRWMNVAQLLTFMQGTHPKFCHKTAAATLQGTNIELHRKVGELSKGMITKLHLALIMAIDAKLLVLDEPTLGLDIVNRRDFYSCILDDYFEQGRSIIITTHLVEEVEHILTDVMLLKEGKLIVNEDIDTLKNSIVEIEVASHQQEAALALKPLYSKPTLAGRSYFYDKPDDELPLPGERKIPSLADIFVALLQSGTQEQEKTHA